MTHTDQNNTSLTTDEQLEAMSFELLAKAIEKLTLSDQIDSTKNE